MLDKIKRILFLQLLFSVILLPKVLAQDLGSAFGNVGNTLGNTIAGMLRMIGNTLGTVLMVMPENPIYMKILIVIPIIIIFYGELKKILGTREKSGSVAIFVAIIVGLITFFGIPDSLVTSMVDPEKAGIFIIFIIACLMNLFSTGETGTSYAVRSISDLAILVGLGYLSGIFTNGGINIILALLSLLVFILFIYNFVKSLGKARENIRPRQHAPEQRERPQQQEPQRQENNQRREEAANNAQNIEELRGAIENLRGAIAELREEIRGHE